MDAILIQANAKLNLDLKILGKRTNGHHLIKSVFQSINLSDFLFFEKHKKNEFTGAIICPKSENIILKAKKTLEKTLNRKLPCRINLQKTIPISAGLGGGSADAAASLFALNLLYKLNLSKKGGTCQIEGIGEKITPIKKKLPKFFVLFRPHKRIETKKMYEFYDKTGRDFLILAKEICPDILKIENYLKKFKLETKLSGSGPTVFCETNNYETAKKITENYQRFNGDIFICRPENKAIKILKP
jgi:4-diphosphocytidyl-2-C-methyl-D-erythritol kinase